MKNYLKIFLSIFLLLLTINSSSAYKKKDVPDILNNIIQELPIEKKTELLENNKVKLFIKDQINDVFLNSFVYKNIKIKAKNDITLLKENTTNKEWIISEDFSINMEINKYNLLDPVMLLEEKEKLRKVIVRELFEQGIVKIEDDLSQFNVEIFPAWNIEITKNWYVSKKNNYIDDYINFIFKEILSELKVIDNARPEENMYYNYLYDNKIIYNITKPIKFDIFKNSLIIRNVDDYNALFKVTSFRFRWWYKWDKPYRQYNIKKLYDTVKWNTLVLYPEQTLSFNNLYVMWDTAQWTKYKNGTAIINGKEKEWIYWGWVCWAATWFYQWALYNKNIESKTRNHSLWYNSYVANINGKQIWTPWLDSTYFWESVDLKMKNVGKYPIIMINRIWEPLNVEENFTLSMRYEEDDKIDSIKFIKRVGNCFTWKIGDNYKKSCYKKIMTEKND